MFTQSSQNLASPVLLLALLGCVLCPPAQASKVGDTEPGAGCEGTEPFPSFTWLLCPAELRGHSLQVHLPPVPQHQRAHLQQECVPEGLVSEGSSLRGQPVTARLWSSWLGWRRDSLPVGLFGEGAALVGDVQHRRFFKQKLRNLG